MFPLIFVPKNILCQKSWFLHLHFESFFKKVQTNFSTKGKKSKRYVLTFLLFSNNQHVKRGQWWTLSCRQCCAAKNKFCPNVQTNLAPLPKISWKLNEATPKFMISPNFSWPSSSTYTSLVSPVILICQVMSGRKTCKIHSNSFVNLLPKVTRFRAFRRITENASARWFIPPLARRFDTVFCSVCIRNIWERRCTRGRSKLV